MVKRSALALAVVVAILVASVGAATPSQAAPVAPASVSGTAPPPPSALVAQPRDSRYARQVLERLHPGEIVSDDDVVGLAEEIGEDGASAALVAPLTGRWLSDRLAEDYQRYLERPIDPAGLAYWRSRVIGAFTSGSGPDVEVAAATIGSSAEAWRRSGQTNAGFVDRSYQTVLGRAADPSGRAYWIARLDGGTSRWVLVRTLLRSNERANRLVGQAYLDHLGRAADAGGRASWVSRYRAGATGEMRLVRSLLASSEARRSGCDGFDPRLCLLPFPNDRFTVADPTTETGRRVALKPEWMPRNASGTPVDPVEWNRNDGFSPGQAALLKVPGIDLDETDAVPLDDLGSYDDEDAPIVVIDAVTGERHPVFVELDANIEPADQAADQLLFIRPAQNYVEGRRYIVALRDLRRADGSVIEAPASFTTYRDGEAGQAIGDVEARRPHMESIFEDLAGAGIGRDDLYLAWDFTVASTENLSGRARHVRDAALDVFEAGTPSFTVTSVQENPDTGVLRRIEGTFEVPSYLEGAGAPGDGFNTGPDGLAVQNGTYTASFGCILPEVEGTSSARPVVYGHGLFGSYGEVFSSPQRAMVREHDAAYCATDWIGMSSPDVANAATILGDLSTFNTLADRSQQGFVNFMVLGRLMTEADGFATDANFQHGDGSSRIDGDALFYDGNSQGAILGGAYLALSPDTEAGVLGVAGMNYSTLLERSVDFDPFAALMKPNYPSAPDRVLALGLIQMLWDRGETNGYAAHLGTDPLPGSSGARVLVHTALGDHQVAPFTAEILARTAGMAIHRPTYPEGRTTDVEPGWDLPSIAYPSSGSALVLWDSGSPLAPLGNVPPRDGRDPHGDPRSFAPARQQKSAFLQVDGTITDVCGDEPCTIPIP
jgi:hypothetical protein